MNAEGNHIFRQHPVQIPYKNIKPGTDLGLDLLVEEKVIIEPGFF
ncbi:MAG: hypothetical protein GX556_13030 [Fibrobacter sp.]|nr:hypothetical protein [Fibrobacter sp.]